MTQMINNATAKVESKEDKTMAKAMTTAGTQEAFKYNNCYYTKEKTGYCYRQPVGGIKKRIGKADFEQAWNEYLEEIRKQEELAKAEAAKEATSEATEETAGTKADESPSEKDTAKKAARKPRKSKDIAMEIKMKDDRVLTLTAKQVDFIKHIPDTCFYENGLESMPWCDVLADEIGGQFAGKPMTVGAMISTLREKGVIYVGVDRVNNKKCKYFGFTEIGKKIAAELGLQ